jgi:pimeloyl-ACP methyl ester carboxylesterase
MHITVGGREYRIYYEEAGSGFPLLLGHTAGSDGREYRHMMNDRDVTDHFRCIAFDLPYHGKSLPPYGVEWWTEKYKIFTKEMMDYPNAIVDALELNDPIYMGMSMGGHLAMDLALYYPDKYLCTIAIEGALHTNAEYAAQGIEQVNWEFDHPMISRNELGAAMLLNMSPTSPEKNVKECMWTYMQSGPGIFAGDLYYYNDDHNITVDQAQSIDTSKCMLYMLTGEYDPNTTPEDTQKIADLVKGSYFRPMKGLGHFPVIENYNAFKEYLVPILDDILKRYKK